MVDWMAEVVFKAESAPQTLFLAVNIMDRFLQASSKSYKAADLHLIGVVSMLLSSKLLDVSGMDIHFMYEQVVHRKVSLKEMVAFELTILQALDFYLSGPTELDIVGVLVAHFPDSDSSSVRRLASNYAMLNLYDRPLSELKPSLRAAASVFLALSDCSSNPLEVEKGTLSERKLGWISTLCRLCKTNDIELTTACTSIGKHKAAFEQLYPKLKNAHYYAAYFAT